MARSHSPGPRARWACSMAATNVGIVGDVRRPDERRALGGREGHQVDVVVVEARDQRAPPAGDLDVARARLEPAVDRGDRSAARPYVDEHPVDDDVAQHQVRHGKGTHH